MKCSLDHVACYSKNEQLMSNSLDHVACQSKNVQIIGSMQPRKRSASASSETIRVKGSLYAAIRVFSIHPFVE